MAYGLFLHSYADGRPVGEWLKTFDLEAGNGIDPYRRGFVDTTPDPREAMRFTNQQEAMNYWRQQSRTAPLRPDGKPNRPLTIFSALVQELPEGVP